MGAYAAAMLVQVQAAGLQLDCGNLVALSSGDRLIVIGTAAEKKGFGCIVERGCPGSC